MSVGVFLSAKRRSSSFPSRIRFVTVSPFNRCSACDRFGSIFTSQEQTVSRVARPNVVRKYVVVLPSANLHGAGAQRQAGNLFFVSVTCVMQSSSTSARMRRTRLCEKLRSSPALVSFVCD